MFLYCKDNKIFFNTQIYFVINTRNIVLAAILGY